MSKTIIMIMMAIALTVAPANAQSTFPPNTPDHYYRPARPRAVYYPPAYHGSGPCYLYYDGLYYRLYCAPLPAPVQPRTWWPRPWRRPSPS